MESIKAIDRANDMINQLGWRVALLHCIDFIRMNQNEKNWDRASYWREVRDAIFDKVDEILIKNEGYE